LSDSSHNAPSKRDVLGTWLLAILAGHNHYAHITGLRGDAASPQILGLNKIISEDALRRALSRMKAEQSQAWLAPQLLTSVSDSYEATVRLRRNPPYSSWLLRCEYYDIVCTCLHFPTFA
jgi:hypothetical protein